MRLKSYTDLEQSKKLAEFLPLESADMHWSNFYPKGLGYSNTFKPSLTAYNQAIGTYELLKKDYKVEKYKWKMIPCWSLAALLKIIRSACNYELLSIEENKIFGVCKLEISTCRFLTEIYDNELDVCYEMILKLHKLNIL